MGIRILTLIKRKPGLTPEQFREGYENSHAKIAMELFGHLYAEYRRNYLGRAFSFADSSVTDGPDEIGFDAVSEVVLKDGVTMQDMAKIMDAHRERIVEDEKRWFHRKRSWVTTCDTVEVDLDNS